MIRKRGEDESTEGFCWWGKLKVRDHLEYVGVDGRIMLKFILKK